MTIEHVDQILESPAFTSLPGWCTPEKGKRMARLLVEAARDDRPVLACELGVFGGRGVVACGLAVKHVLQDKGQVHGIDPYSASAALEGVQDPTDAEWWVKIDYAKILADAIKTISDLGLHGVTIIKRPSQDVVGDYTDGSIDVLHIDANHSELCSRRDVELWAPKVSPEGFIVFDDINWETTRKAQQDLSDKGFTLQENHETWAVYHAPS